MTKSKALKTARQLILKNGYSHQEAFDEIRQNKEISAEDVATMVSRVPSHTTINKVAVWRIVYIVMMVLVVVLRVISVMAMGGLTGNNNGMLLLLVVASIVVPILAIVSVLQHNYEGLKMISILLILSVLRSFKNFEAEWYVIIPLIPYVGAVILGFILGPLAKVPYKEEIREYTAEDGSIKKRREYIFEAQKAASGNDILDA